MWSAICVAPLNESLLAGFHVDQLRASPSRSSEPPAVSRVSSSTPEAIAHPSSSPPRKPKRARNGEGPWSGGGAAAAGGSGIGSNAPDESGSGAGRPAGEGGGIRSPATSPRL